MKTMDAHFDGQRIVLDDAVTLKTNARLKVTEVENGSAEAEMIRACARLSESVLQNIWDNPLDADYDNL